MINSPHGAGMTFSLLARDPATGALGGAAATGNLCVGGWVLRGDARGGLTASQGLSPSFLWGEDALARLVAGAGAAAAVEAVVGADAGRAARQLAALDRQGATAVFTGADNLAHAGHLDGPGWVVTGNWLDGPRVLQAAAEAFDARGDDFEAGLVAALAAGVAAGSDRRGTLSAALLVVGPDRPPLTLRIDHDRDPVARLGELLARTRTPDYAAWLATLPTRSHPETA